jgi:DNA-binding beta-propeller fold protein YncE
MARPHVREASAQVEVVRLAALLAVAACHSNPSPSPTPSQSPSPTPTPTLNPRTVTIDARGIGFDDLVFADHHVLVPAGATGTVAVVDPMTLAVESKRVAAASTTAYRPAHHDDGITSAASTPSGLVATDRTSKTLFALDGSKVALAAEPDYVRFVAPTNELWVTEPDEAQIEVFSPPPFKRVLTFAVPGGPESLVVSASRKTAYANLWHKKSVEIDLAAHAIKRTFDTACDKTRGIALDDAGGLLFVACNDGRIVRLELDSGKMTDGHAGDGVDIIDFSPKTGHLYVPASRAGTLTVFSTALAVVRTEPVPKGAHCVVADDRGQAWVCDPDHGAVVVFSENP